MKYLKSISTKAIICYLLLSIVSCSNVCLNPDCRFEQLEAPITLTSKSFNTIILTDSNGKIWQSSTGWNIAQNILTDGYQIGDTIGYYR